MAIVKTNSKNKTFYGVIICSIFLFFYLLAPIFKAPLIGIMVEQVQQEWLIHDFSYPKWAEQYNVEKGAAVKEVNHQPIKVSADETLYTIKSASSILIQDNQGNNQQIEITYSDFPIQFFFYIVIPSIYFIISLILCIYLYMRGSSFQSSTIFMLFILTVALTYVSMGVASHSISFGIFIVSNGVIGSLILLLHFLINYLRFLNIKHRLIIKPPYLYGILIISVLLTSLEKIVPTIYQWNTMLILILVGLLVIYALLILLITYIKYRKQQLAVLLFCLVTPFLPMILFYVLPMLLFQQYIFSIIYCALFLLLIPILLLLTQLPDYLFDIDYELSKIRYYSALAIITSSLFSIGIYFMLDVQLLDVFKCFVFLFIVILALLYIKEKIDYANRKVLYSSKGDYVHFVYKTINQITRMPSVDKLLKHFSEALAQQLSVSHVEVHIYSTTDLVADSKIIKKLTLGTVKKVDGRYIGCLHETLDEKYIVTIANEGGLYLKKEELLCLELLMMYVSNFIDNTQFVEGLIEQLETSQQGNPAWLKKFVWSQLENEKSQLAQELHDTILQQQLFLIRELDVAQIDPQLIKQQREGLIQLNSDLRQYCEQLRPPLLEKQGLQAALNKLFVEVERQADFTIIHEIEKVALDTPELPLVIYRTIQEMLNNALKHSQATYVKITLAASTQGFELVYFDNGVGCDLSEIEGKNSMGLQGMKERVFAYNGSFELTSALDEGMHIVIKVKE